MSVIRNSFRCSAKLFKNYTLTNSGSPCAALSTAIDTLQSAAQDLQNDPDKLFKRVELEIKGNDPAVLKSYSIFSASAAGHLGVEVSKNWALRKTENELHTLLKSVHIHKKHKVQYHIRTYYRFIHLNRLTGSTCETLLEYLERNLPEGVAMKVTKVEIQKVPEYILDVPKNQQINE